jgi:hypothetical protein
MGIWPGNLFSALVSSMHCSMYYEEKRGFAILLNEGSVYHEWGCPCIEEDRWLRIFKKGRLCSEWEGAVCRK